MTTGIQDFHRLVILNQATPRCHWRVLLSLEKKRYGMDAPAQYVPEILSPPLSTAPPGSSAGPLSRSLGRVFEHGAAHAELAMRGGPADSAHGVHLPRTAKGAGRPSR